MNDELYHYGVPGMKWGHKKAVAYDPIGDPRTNRKAFKQQLKLERQQAKINIKKAKVEQNEINKDARKMWRHGRPGSEADVYSKGKSTALYNTLSKTKGKQYADRVLDVLNKKVERRERQEREERERQEREARIERGVSIVNGFIDRLKDDNN